MNRLGSDGVRLLVFFINAAPGERRVHKGIVILLPGANTALIFLA